MIQQHRQSYTIWILFLLLSLLKQYHSFQLGKLFGGFKPPAPVPSVLSPIVKTKQELLSVISNTGNGKDASLETQKMALQLVHFLETNAPTPDDLLQDPAAAMSLDGVWYLQYTAPSDAELDGMV